MILSRAAQTRLLPTNQPSLRDGSRRFQRFPKLKIRKIKKIMILLDFRSSAASRTWMHAYEQGRPRSCMHRLSTGIDRNTSYNRPTTSRDRWDGPRGRGGGPSGPQGGFPKNVIFSNFLKMDRPSLVSGLNCSTGAGRALDRRLL